MTTPITHVTAGAPPSSSHQNNLIDVVNGLASQLAAPLGDTGNVSRGSTTSTTYTTTLTSSTDTPVQQTFTAPQSGTVLVVISALIVAATGGEGVISYQIKDSGGTVVQAADDKRAISADTINLRNSRTCLCTGLTAGATYTAQMMFRSRTGSSISFDPHDLIVVAR